jgi:hypothetical protein
MPSERAEAIVDAADLRRTYDAAPSSACGVSSSAHSNAAHSLSVICFLQKPNTFPGSPADNPR